MTSKTKLIQYLQNHPACIDLKELSFGCEVNRKGTFFVGTSDDYDQHWFHTPDLVSGGADDIYYQDDINTDDFYIIGHPPTLRHLLLVLREEQSKSLIQANGVVCYWKGNSFEEEQRVIVTQINLTQPLTNQTEEVYTKLVELLEIDTN